MTITEIENLAIKILNNKVKNRETLTYSMAFDAIGDFLKEYTYIKKADDWVRFSDQLPDPTKLIFVADNDDILLEAFKYIPQNKSKNSIGYLRGKNSTIDLYRVTHWLYLPTSPKTT